MMRESVPAPTDIENQLETQIKMELHNLSPMSPLRCIYRVPDRLRRVRKRDYTPRVISIGPFHHENKALKPMEVHKRWYLKCFKERTQSNLNDYIGKIRERKEALQNCYSETIKLSSDQFVRMILVDAIFLIEFLLRCTGNVPLDENDDCIFGKPNMVQDVQDDLLMLENQLPLFIMEDLLCLYNPDLRGEAKKLSIQFLIGLQDLMGLGVNLPKEVEGKHLVDLLSNLSEVVKGEHFVDLLRNLSAMKLGKDSVMKLGMGKTKTAIAPSIEKLHLAGVVFKLSPDSSEERGSGDSKTPVINFYKTRILRKGVLEIPKLRIDDSTELILRNLTAFEQCSKSEDPIISHFVILMDMLVNRPKDVELLVDHDIVENNLSNDDYQLSSMINRLSKGLECDHGNFYFGALCNNLQEYCGKDWPKWMANLRGKYFNTPWATLSVVAAIFLLIFTAFQTVCSILSTFF